MSPRVSVVIPVFNRPDPLCRAVESVMAQTCQDFEIIVVDDASTDRTPTAIGALGDPRIRSIRHDRNRGGSAARNTGIRASSAPYIAFLDSDDEWLPTKLERQLEVFDRSPEQLGLVYTGAERIFSDGTISRYIPDGRRDLTHALLTETVVLETSLGMVRRSALEAIGGFDEDLPSSQDVDLWLRLCERYDADVVADALVRISKGSDSGRISANVARTQRGRELFYQKHREKLLKHGALHVFLRETGWWQQRRVGDPRAARRFYRESLEVNAKAPFTYVLLGVSYLPMSWLDGLAKGKHVLSGVLRFGHDITSPRASYRLGSTETQQQRAPKGSAGS